MRCCLQDLLKYIEEQPSSISWQPEGSPENAGPVNDSQLAGTEISK